MSSALSAEASVMILARSARGTSTSVARLTDRSTRLLRRPCASTKARPVVAVAAVRSRGVNPSSRRSEMLVRVRRRGCRWSAGRRRVGSEAGYDGTRHNTMMASYMDALAARGLVRSDLATPELTYAFQSVFEGFIYAERTAGSTGTRDERARLLSATVESAFSRPGTPDAALADEVAALLSGLV